jgi:RNA polymerase sigma-70 factor (ECF subfamily)
MDAVSVLDGPGLAGRRALVMGAAAGGERDPETEALAALEHGDLDAALDVLMHAYGTALYRYCCQMVRDEEMARDAHQLAFVQAYEGLPRFSRRSSLRTWLFGIARHRCLDALKVDRRRRARFHELTVAGDRPTPAPSAEESLATRSLAGALEACLRQLAPRIRSTVLLRFQQGLSYPEIARLSGEAAATLQVRVARALPVLRRCLEQRGVTP